MNAASLAARNPENLKSLDPARAQVTNALLRLLSANGNMTPAVVDSFPKGGLMLVDGGMAFAIMRDGTNLIETMSGIDQACAALDVADPLLSQIERTLDIALEPAAISEQAGDLFSDEKAIILRCIRDDVTVCLGLRPDETQRFAWIEAAARTPPDPAKVPAWLSITFEAARLPVAEAQGIEGGDLLLLPGAASAYWHAVTHEGKARLDLRQMLLRPEILDYDEEDGGMIDDSDGGTPAGFSVPLTVRLPTITVDAATLGALHEGGSLQLGPLTQGLAVELLVGGRRIACGEIVEIGANFAVLIDERTMPHAPQAETTEDED
ncbi:MAG: FliM/FliN family flagellar motor switch protein [Sphingorhabdus sp.]